MASALGSNKTKIARRIVEVLEFFALGNDQATVMDVARKFGRPQSSTSELLSAMVEMGLLYKDQQARCYLPTPRLAALGLAGQPESIRNGRLFGTMDRLAQSSRLTVALFGLVRTHVQVFRLSTGVDAPVGSLCNGDAMLLSESAAGLLLLAAQGPVAAGRIMWRLNGEAAPDKRFDLAAMKRRVTQLGRDGHATGDCGFVQGMRATAMLTNLPHEKAPLALAFLYAEDSKVDSGALVATLRRAIDQAALQDGEREGSFLRSLERA